MLQDVLVHGSKITIANNLVNIDYLVKPPLVGGFLLSGL